ncbi:hypothetical protein CNMCM5623_008648 [Aspergillus felis]|uniref:Mutanase n=1 Tax=Aspergillus felis TaxID=1287682 RepID=A0A8H6QLM5_9EURO|nr:hypothetical protein CNMCM5623_008648 [Aspergillus felis]KAF7176161.1 hypothetical protein CNMCM7691_001637 [Aspergillus felis]
MVTNSANYTLDDWATDMKLAQDAHIDTFALNMAYNDPTNMKALPAAFATADKLGFKLFFSFDYAGNGNWPRSDVINLINQYSARSSYYFHRRQAFVSTFEGPGRAADWPLIKAATGCFFVPSWSSLGAKPAVETGVVDGLFSWAAWPWGPQDMDTYVDASYLQYLASLPYMMPEVLFVQPEFVKIISWNDYGESHYIGPLYDKAMEAFNIGRAPFNYVTGMPHDGWRLILPFFIDMYKQGTATVTEEGVVAWYRLSPGAACGSGGTSGNTASQLQIEFPPAEMAQDRIFYSAVLGSFAGVTVSIGGSTMAGTWSSVPNEGVGVYHGSVPFDGRSGDVTITLTQNNAMISEVKGKPILTGCPNGIQNWNAWVGSATTSSKVSATPKLLLTEQGNLGGLYDFGCAHGFCPMNACTCTAQGALNVMDPTKDIVGMAAAGLDATIYGPLCNFACQRGYCPEGACMAKTGGSGSGSGSGSRDSIVYIAPKIWNEPTPVIQCEPPCTLVLPPLPLDAPSTISIPPWSTPVTRKHATISTTTFEDGRTTTYDGYDVTTTTIILNFPTMVVEEIPVWQVVVNASQVSALPVQVTSSIDLPHMVYVLPPDNQESTAPSMTTTITPPPYPWSQTTKDPKLNTRPTQWVSRSPSPSASHGSPGTGHRCGAFCNGPCLLCPPNIGGSSAGGGGSSSGSDSSEGNDEDCSTQTARVSSTACIAGSGCDFAYSTTTGCSETPSSTKTVSTPPPGVAVTLEQWPVMTDDPAAFDSIASSLDSVLSSLYGPLTVFDATTTEATTTTTTTTTSPATVTTWLSSYDCKGETLCSTTNVKWCDKAVNQMNRGQTIYTSNAEALALSGNCWANNAGFGCSVQIRGTDQNGKNCKITGDEMWQAYQDIRKVGGCGKCGTKHFGNGCIVSTDYYYSCDNRDSGVQFMEAFTETNLTDSM